MTKDDIDRNVSWYMSIWRSFVNPNAKIVVKEQSQEQQTRDWLKGKDRKSPDELALELLEKTLLISPGNIGLIERIARLKSRLGLWD